MTARHRALEEDDVALIESVKMMPSLYDPRNANFRLAYRKEQVWESVSEALGLSSGADARRRWTVLRDRYSRELKQMRLHPEKDDFGKTDFFRQMDFLRKFVRKRKERRRNFTPKYESWDGSAEVVKLVEKLTQSVEVEDDEEENEEARIEEEEDGAVEEEHSFEDTQHEYVSKMEVAEEQEEATHVAEEYPEFEEVDATGGYEEYVENQAVHVSCSSSSTSSSPTKPCDNSQLLPIILPHTSGCSVAGAAYTITTTSMPALMQPHQHQPHQQQPKQSPLEHLQHYQPQQQQQPQLTVLHHQQRPHPRNQVEAAIETEDDFFCKSIAAYLRQLSRRHKIKAKVEMFQILEKYIELEESANGAAP